jgi:hypothetical protein
MATRAARRCLLRWQDRHDGKPVLGFRSGGVLLHVTYGRFSAAQLDQPCPGLQT